MVTGSGTDDEGNPVSDDDDATVTITDVPPAASLVKIATQAVVTYKVTITNDSTASTDALTLTHLDDDVYGNLLGPNANVSNNSCQALLNTEIPFGDSISCSFDATVISDSGAASVTDVVTGQLKDDDGTEVDPDPQDSAAVTLTP